MQTIYGTLDLPHYLRILAWWREYPPLWSVPRALVGAGSGEEAPRERRPMGDNGPEPPRQRQAGAFVQQFIHGFDGQTSVRRVSKTYYEDFVKQLDANTARLRAAAGDT